jgi:hypothetical protein
MIQYSLQQSQINVHEIVLFIINIYNVYDYEKMLLLNFSSIWKFFLCCGCQKCSYINSSSKYSFSIKGKHRKPFVSLIVIYRDSCTKRILSARVRQSFWESFRKCVIIEENERRNKRNIEAVFRSRKPLYRNRFSSNSFDHRNKSRNLSHLSSKS